MHHLLSHRLGLEHRPLGEARELLCARGGRPGAQALPLVVSVASFFILQCALCRALLSHAGTLLRYAHRRVQMGDEVYVNGGVVLPHKEIKANILKPQIIM